MGCNWGALGVNVELVPVEVMSPTCSATMAAAEVSYSQASFTLSAGSPHVDRDVF